MLTLPIAEQKPWLALFAFIGGLSAATGMVIVETIALSTMVCNDLVMPVLLRMKALRLTERRDLSGLLLGIRRGAIVLILVLGYLYFYLAGEAYALVSIGLISFSAVAQFAPGDHRRHLLEGRHAHRRGLRPGSRFPGVDLHAAAALLRQIGLAADHFSLPGPVRHRTCCRPQQLFGLYGLDDITHCLFWSMLANIGCYIGISLIKGPSAAEHGQATVFVDALKHTVSDRRLALLARQRLGERPAGRCSAAFWDPSGRARRSPRMPAAMARNRSRRSQPMPTWCTTRNRCSPAPSAAPRRA